MHLVSSCCASNTSAISPRSANRTANSRIPTPRKSLTRHDKMRPAVLRPRPLVVAGLEGKFLPVADGAEVISGNAERHEIVSRRKRTALAKRQVVFCRTPLVGVPFDRDDPRRVFFHQLGV